MGMMKCKECGNQVSTKAEKCPSCGAPTKKGLGILKLAAIVFGSLVLIGTCSAVMATGKGEETSTAVAGNPTEGTASRSVAEAGEPRAKSNLGDHLEFGKPTLKSMGVGSMAQVLVETKNTGSTGITCLLTATFKKGDEILGAANGTVNDIPPQGTKTAELMITDSIDGYDTVKLETSGCFPTAAKSSSAASGARSGDPLKFGKPTVKALGANMSKLLVEATNTTEKELTCTVTATFKKGDEITNTANGALNGIGAGATKTAELMTTGSLGEYDNVILEASACF